MWDLSFVFGDHCAGFKLRRKAVRIYEQAFSSYPLLHHQCYGLPSIRNLLDLTIYSGVQILVAGPVIHTKVDFA
jgi:hypothetical protein